MSPSKLHEWVHASSERARSYAQEALIVDVAEEIWAALAKSELTKADLAARLGRSKAFITQLLNGSRNMTLRTLADIAYALDQGVAIQLKKRDEPGMWQDISAEVPRRQPLMSMDVESSNDSTWHNVTPIRPKKAA
jgi:transcriptional regulator with XRE-family HTH domain